MTIDNLFREAVKKEASDIHLVVGQPPILRINGELKSISEGSTISPANMKDLIFDILTERQREKFEQNREFDVSYEISRVARYRINIHFERGNMGLVARIIPDEIPSPDKILLPEIVYNFMEKNSGLILLTGPTGCGKSTTMASIIEHINKERTTHIVTMEDPIEFIFIPKKSLIIQRQLHTDMLSFESALTHVLRQDPNIIVVGEMRNLETISAAITLAETGHLVFATLHTHTAGQTIDRILDIFPPNQQEQIRMQLSMTLTGIISQRLLPANKGGRIAAREILVNNPAISNLIREKKIAQIKTVIQTNASEGMFTMDQDITKLYHKGEISLDIARSNVTNPEILGVKRKK